MIAEGAKQTGARSLHTGSAWRIFLIKPSSTLADEGAGKRRNAFPDFHSPENLCDVPADCHLEKRDDQVWKTGIDDLPCALTHHKGSVKILHHQGDKVVRKTKQFIIQILKS